MLQPGLWQDRFVEAMELLNWSAQTVRNYRYGVGYFFDYLEQWGIGSLSHVTRDVVEGYRHHLFELLGRAGQRLSARTQCSRLCAVKAFLRFLAREQYLMLDPAQDLPLPKTPRTLPRNILTEAEVTSLIEAVTDETTLGIRNRAILELLYTTAIRNLELRRLDLSDIRLGRRELLVRGGKAGRGTGARDRLLPLGHDALLWLERYLTQSRPRLCRRPEETALFLTLKRGRISREALIAVVAEAGQRAGIAVRTTPHLLRHCCATHMLSRGAGLRHLQELLGHACVDSTQRYTLLGTTDLRAVLTRYHPRERRNL